MGTTDTADGGRTIVNKTVQNGRKRRRRKWILLAVCAVLLSAAGVCAGYFVTMHEELLRADSEAVEAMVHMEAVELAEYSKTQHRKESVRKNAGKDTTQALVDAARYMLEGIRNRPKEVEVTAENAADFGSIESCLINTETGKIDITMKAKDLAISDDGYY